MDTATFLNDVVYPRYQDANAASPIQWEHADRWRSIFRSRYLAHLDLSGLDARVLELGAGSCAFTAYLRCLGYIQACAVDSSLSQVEAAQRIYPGLPVRLQTNDEALTTVTHPLDAIVMLDVIEHYDLPSAHSLLSLCRSALKPTGRLLLQTPNAASPFGTRGRYCDLTHQHIYTSESLEQLLLLGGFDVTHRAEVRPLPGNVPQSLRALAWNCIRGAVAAYYAVETGTRSRMILSQNMVVVATPSR